MIKATFYGVTGMVALVGLYVAIMRWGSGSWEFTIAELVRLRYWVGALVIGFGVQVGLFAYLKSYGQVDRWERGSVGMGTTTSTLGMIACCAHHLTDILPFLGLAALGGMLAQFQEYFLSLGIFSNLGGIYLMTKRLREVKK